MVSVCLACCGDVAVNILKLFIVQVFYKYCVGIKQVLYLIKI